jgi:hypothetical protein
MNGIDGSRGLVRSCVLKLMLRGERKCGVLYDPLDRVTELYASSQILKGEKDAL